MAITFVRLKEYLNKIAEQANLDPANSGHGVFWNTDYNSFVTGNVPHKQCGGHPVPIIDPANKVNSAFYQILKAGWCTTPAMPQMPKTGPYVSSAGYSITLQDGTVRTGAQVLQDIEDWLRGGALENG
jgi:hypothetical protein